MVARLFAVPVFFVSFVSIVSPCEAGFLAFLPLSFRREGRGERSAGRRKKEKGRRKKEKGRNSDNYDFNHFCYGTLARFKWKRIAGESGKPVACGVVSPFTAYVSPLQRAPGFGPPGSEGILPSMADSRGPGAVNRDVISDGRVAIRPLMRESMGRLLFEGRMPSLRILEDHVTAFFSSLSPGGREGRGERSAWRRKKEEGRRKKEEGRRKKEEGRNSDNYDFNHFCYGTLARFKWKRIAGESGKPVACGVVSPFTAYVSPLQRAPGFGPPGSEGILPSERRCCICRGNPCGCPPLCRSGFLCVLCVLVSLCELIFAFFRQLKKARRI